MLPLLSTVNKDFKNQIKSLTDKRLDTLGYVGVGSYTSLVFSSHSKLIERVLLQLFRQRVTCGRNFILLAAIASPLGSTLHPELDNVIENLCSAIAVIKNVKKLLM